MHITGTGVKRDSNQQIYHNDKDDDGDDVDDDDDDNDVDDDSDKISTMQTILTCVIERKLFCHNLGDII